MTNARLDHYVYTRESLARRGHCSTRAASSCSASRRRSRSSPTAWRRAEAGVRPRAGRVPGAGNAYGWGGVMFVVGRQPRSGRDADRRRPEARGAGEGVAGGEPDRAAPARRAGAPTTGRTSTSRSRRIPVAVLPARGGAGCCCSVGPCGSSAAPGGRPAAGAAPTGTSSSSARRSCCWKCRTSARRRWCSATPGS